MATDKDVLISRLKGVYSAYHSFVSANVFNNGGIPTKLTANFGRYKLTVDKYTYNNALHENLVLSETHDVFFNTEEQAVAYIAAGVNVWNERHRFWITPEEDTTVSSAASIITWDKYKWARFPLVQMMEDELDISVGKVGGSSPDIAFIHAAMNIVISTLKKVYLNSTGYYAWQGLWAEVQDDLDQLSESKRVENNYTDLEKYDSIFLERYKARANAVLFAAGIIPTSI